MMRPGLVLALVLAPMMAMAASGPASAACADFTASQINTEYDPLGAQAGSGQIVLPVTLTAESHGGSPKNVSVQFMDQEPAGTLRIGSNGPVYAIQESGRSVAVPRGALLNASNSFNYTFKEPGSKKAESVPGVQLVIAGGQDVAAGEYGESLDVQFQCDSNGGTDQKQGVLQITVDVPSTLTASLAGSGPAGTLDFEDFSTATHTVMVNVYSTGPYALSIASANAQRMKLVNAPAGAANVPDAQIAYTMTFNGGAVSAFSTTRYLRSGVGGAQLPLAITTEPATGKRAGVYHDAITLTFTPLATL